MLEMILWVIFLIGYLIVVLIAPKKTSDYREFYEEIKKEVKDEGS